MFEELLKVDPEFSESMFKTKVDNTFIMLFTSVMMKEMDNVRHVVSDEVFNKYTDYVDDLIEKNETQMYDMLNVAETEITGVEITDEKIIIKVLLLSKAYDYVMDQNGNIIRGQDQNRETRRNYMTFTKKIGFKGHGDVRKCPGCGASIDANLSGKCEYCDTIYNAVDYDYILDSIEVA